MSSKQSSNTMQRRRHRHGRASASPERKTAPQESSGVGLNLKRLEELLCKTILPFCHNSETRRDYLHQFIGLSEQESLSRSKSQDTISALLEVLNRSPSMPCSLVADIHSKIGLLYMSHAEMHLAIQSLTKSLWVQTSMKSVNSEKVGLALHRLGICHASLGNDKEARQLFKKALELYNTTNRKSNPKVIHAQEELDRLEPKDQGRNVRRKSNEGLALKLEQFSS
jgi:tetratricopeptide (TPR) repeat protein